MSMKDYKITARAAAWADYWESNEKKYDEEAYCIYAKARDAEGAVMGAMCELENELEKDGASVTWHRGKNRNETILARPDLYWSDALVFFDFAAVELQG